MTIEYADLSKHGLIYHPHDGAVTGTFTGHAIEFLNTDRDFPEIVGTVPDLRGFASGIDYNVGAFEIKAQNSRIVRIPSNLDFLFPAAALIMDDFYATAGPKAADQCQVSLQFFRRDYPRGEHLPFDQIHRHATEGKMVIYVVTAVEAGERGDPYAAGTEFYAERVIGKPIGRARRASSPADFRRQFSDRGAVAAPGAAIIRFGETTLHAAPDIAHSAASARPLFAERNLLRRSLLNIIASHKDTNGMVYGRSRPQNDHRASPVSETARSREQWQHDASAPGKAKAGELKGTLVSPAPWPTADRRTAICPDPAHGRCRRSA